jgi:RNA polymerase sigma-70 factor (ECF subfamily)
MFNEQEDIPKILKGDLGVFELLVKQYERLVYTVVSRVLNQQEDIEDVCQEVFIKVHRSLRNFKFASRLSTWIARIAYLSSINYLKKYKKLNTAFSPDDLEQVHFTEENPETAAFSKDASAYINRLMNELPEVYRTVLTLYHLQEFSYQEIAAITGMPEGTVKSYLFRARKMMKEKLVAYLKKEIV